MSNTSRSLDRLNCNIPYCVTFQHLVISHCYWMYLKETSEAWPFLCIPAITALAHPCAADAISCLRHTWMYQCRVRQDAGNDHGCIDGIFLKIHSEMETI